MANIPPEIWCHIAKFILKEDLRDLFGVNKVFFNIAMNIRYREIDISTRTTDQDIMIKTLKRISDPFVASLVYRLQFTHVKKTSAVMSASNSIRRQLKHTIVRVFGGSRSHKMTLINEFLNITNKLVNVRELYIEIRDPLHYDLQPLFSSFWSSFGPKLYTLSLRGFLEDFRTLINSNPSLRRLRDLRIEFNHPYTGPIQPSWVILVDLLLPFINNLAPHLLSLRLWSQTTMDLSTFFSQLAPFPGLKALSVRTHFRNFGDASGLKGLICDSSDTLQSVCLHLNLGVITLNPSAEERLSRWLLVCISDECFFSKLQVLDIYPTNTAAGMEFLYGCIQRTSRNLVKLSIRDRYLQDHEIMTVIDAASSCHDLTFLSMNIWRLNIALTDHLALKLPKIKRLWLSIENSTNNPFDFNIANRDTLLQDLDTRLYTNWKLEDISIWQNGQEVDSIVLSAFAQSIPSLTSFFQRDEIVPGPGSKRL